MLGATELRGVGTGLPRSLSRGARSTKLVKTGLMQGLAGVTNQDAFPAGAVILLWAEMVGALPMIAGPGSSGVETLWIGGEHRLSADERRPARRRARELNWRKTHEVELQAHLGQWVVLEGEEVIAHGEDPAAVVEEARRKGVLTPYVFKLERPRTNTAWIGL